MSECLSCGHLWQEASKQSPNNATIHCPRCGASMLSMQARQSRPEAERGLETSASRAAKPAFTSPPTANPSPSAGELRQKDADSRPRTIASTAHQELATSPFLIPNGERVIQSEKLYPSAEVCPETAQELLREKVFVIQEDAHGLRLSGIPGRRSNPISELSPNEIVRLAAELEGGPLPIEKRKRCLRCDAVVGPSDKRCQWCSEPLSS